MASATTSALFLVALLLFTTHGHGQGIVLPSLRVTGGLCCTSTGNCPGQGINGTVVRLNCTNILGVTTTVGQSTTNATGFFNISVPSITGILLGLPTIPCAVSVQLPLNATICPVLSTTTGVLASAVQSVGTVVNTTLGTVLNVVITGFIRLTV
ncbi:hypothetical protein Salat_1147500 [Sesamum alatum]|uniref:Pollen Ole e 1 allergen and extensin family protein n=1 Tax=Sesamum alatum TaxID=300844 RepID=A0AAE2CNK9_9LAMI|nr:hypothetical protein Salat_1147500 [Sesamum alatum]